MSTMDYKLSDLEDQKQGTTGIGLRGSVFVVSLFILGSIAYWQNPPKTADNSTFLDTAVIVLDAALLYADGLIVLQPESDKPEDNAGDRSIPTFQNAVVSAHKTRRNQVVELADTAETTVATFATENEIRELLDAGQAALKLDRLQTPKNDNAVDRFQAVLALQPDNEEALLGIQQVQQRYLSFIRSVIAKKHYYKIPDLVSKAREVGTKQSDIEVLLNDIPGSASHQVSGVLRHSKSKRQPLPPQSKQDNDDKFAERDMLVVEQASNAHEAGEYLRAEALLHEFVSKNPQSVYALQALFDNYVSQRRLQEAKDLVDRASHLPGKIFSYMVGQLLARRGDIEGAMRALNLHRPSMREMPRYHALKAGLLYKADRQEDAMAVYRQLINIDHENANYWLGLAVSMDALQAEHTREVFEVVRKLSETDAGYMVYVNHRIDRLARLERQQLALKSF